MDPRVRSLERPGTSVHLEPKVMEVLLCLVERAGEPVRREEIEDRVWPGAVIGQDTLNRAISKLRKVLGDEAGRGGVIETIPKLGYRLTLPVSPAGMHPVPAAEPANPTRWWIRGGVAAVLATAAATLVLRAGPRSPSTTAVDPRILPLTSEPGYESAPSISPDGAFVAFQRYDKSRPGPRTWDVYIVAVGGNGPPRPLAATDAEEYGPAWSPVGDTVAFLLRSDAECAVVLQSAVGGSAERLTACDPDASYELDWYPDGRALMMARGGSEPGLFRLDRGTGELTRLTHPSADGFLRDAGPRVSPDGTRVAFVRSRTDGISDVYLGSAVRAEEPRRLTGDHRRVAGLAWMPAGDGILFSSNRGGNSHLWRLSLAGGEPVRVPMSGRHAGHLSMSASGVLAYEEYNGDSNIWEFASESSTVAVPWNTDTRSEWSPRISPDGSRVAFLSDRSGGAEVWVSDRDGARPRRLSDLQGAVVDPARWSPDGRYLAYAAAEAGHFDLYTVAVASGAVQRVTEDPADERAPSWAGSAALVFASNRTGGWELWRQPLDGSEATRLTRDGGFGSTVGTDGRIYFTRRDRAGLYVLDGKGNAALLWDEPDPDDWANYVLTSSDVRYLRAAGPAVPLVRIFTFRDGRVRVLPIPGEETPSIAGISVGPDGAMLFSQIDRSESDLWTVTGLTGVSRPPGAR